MSSSERAVLVAAGLVVAGLAPLAVAGCIDIACDPAQPRTTCPAGEICDADRAVCIDDGAAIGDGDGDGDGPCTVDCEGPIGLGIPNPQLIHVAGGSAFVTGTETELGDPTVYEVPLSGNGFSLVGGLADSVVSLARVDDVLYAATVWASNRGDLVRKALAGGTFETVGEIDYFNNVPFGARVLAAAQGFLFVVDDSRVVRLDQSDEQTVSVDVDARGIVVSSTHVYAWTGSAILRLPLQFTASQASDNLGLVPGSGTGADLALVEEPGDVDRLIVARDPLPSGAGAIVSLRGDGGEVEILTDDVDPEVASEGDKGVIVGVAATASAVCWVAQGRGEAAAGPHHAYCHARASGQTALVGTVSAPGGVATDGTTLYVTNRALSRVERFAIP